VPQARDPPGPARGRRRRAVDSVNAGRSSFHPAPTDSTILADAVAAQDTVTQLIAAFRRVARQVPGASQCATEAPPPTTPGSSDAPPPSTCAISSPAGWTTPKDGSCPRPEPPPGRQPAAHTPRAQGLTAPPARSPQASARPPPPGSHHHATPRPGTDRQEPPIFSGLPAMPNDLSNTCRAVGQVALDDWIAASSTSWSRLDAPLRATSDRRRIGK